MVHLFARSASLSICKTPPSYVSKFMQSQHDGCHAIRLFIWETAIYQHQMPIMCGTMGNTGRRHSRSGTHIQNLVNLRKDSGFTPPVEFHTIGTRLSGAEMRMDGGRWIYMPMMTALRLSRWRTLLRIFRSRHLNGSISSVLGISQQLSGYE